MTIAAIPSPSNAVWHLGPIPIRAYALCIVLGIVVACVVTEVRLRRRGAAAFAVLDVAVWAVPFGIVGARLYHVISSPQAYFGEGGSPLEALKIWQGGLSIWGAVAAGALGAWLGCRQLGIPLGMFADALAPGLPLAQAVGRLGNWFNNELHGGATSLPWGLEVHRMDPDNPGQALLNPDGSPELLPGLYHPTFAYELLWNVGVAVLVLVLDRRFRFGRGRAFALYVMGYTAGRFWIELMRTDPANEVLGARVNVWVAVLVFLGGLGYFLRTRGARQYLIPDVAQDRGQLSAHRVVGEEEFQRYRQTGPAAVRETTADTPGGTGARANGESVEERTGDYQAGEEMARKDMAQAGTAGEDKAGDVAVVGARTQPAGTVPAPAAPAYAAVGTEGTGVEGSAVPADDDTDDGADLVDASMPPLDDFADDVTDDTDEVDDLDDDFDEDTDGPRAEAQSTARPVGTAEER